MAARAILEHIDTLGWARLTSPGRGTVPPPIIAAADAPWCGARKGGAWTSPEPGASVPATEWMRVTSRDSSCVRGGRMDGSRLPSIVLPVPGGPARRRLCDPAAASSSALLPRSCPRTSARSGRSGGERGSDARDAGAISLLAAEVADRLRDVTHADGVDPGERRLARRVGRAQQPREPRARRTLRGGDRPADATYPPVEPELADARVLFEAGRWDQPGGCEHGERDRNVEARSLLAQCCRREVHRDHLVGPREP